MGLPAPVFLMLAFWWGSIPFWHDDRRIMIHAFIGLTMGLIADATVLRRYLQNLFFMPFGILIALFIFYSILVYGFFMGFPAFNIIVGILGTYIVTRGGFAMGLDEGKVRFRTNRFTLFSMLLLLSLCVCTAWLALREQSIADQIEGMLRLDFEVSMLMVWLLVIIGSVVLLMLQYLGAILAAKTVFRTKPNQ